MVRQDFKEWVKETREKANHFREWAARPSDVYDDSCNASAFAVADALDKHCDHVERCQTQSKQ